MAHTYSGPAHGVGAVHAWKGNKKAGEGRMEIVDADPPHRLDLVADVRQAVQVREHDPLLARRKRTWHDQRDVGDGQPDAAR